MCIPALAGSIVKLSLSNRNRDIVLCEVLVFAEGTYLVNRILMQNNLTCINANGLFEYWNIMIYIVKLFVHRYQITTYNKSLVLYI